MTLLVNIVVCLLTLFCVSAAGASAAHVARDAEQADPISGLHWQLVADPKHPAAPPRLTLMRSSDQHSEEVKQLPRPTVCVRAGDQVLLRGNNRGLSMMSLEATALQNGTCGARVRARVTVTGALVEMTVVDARAGVLSGKAGAGW
jgi:hypothetical protein